VSARVELRSELAHEYVLFGEDASRVLISCDPERLQEIQQIAVKYGISSDLLGETASEKFEIAINGKAVVSAPLAELKDAWEHALERALHVETEERLIPNVLQRS
jgi:hypothetical protein